MINSGTLLQELETWFKTLKLAGERVASLPKPLSEVTVEQLNDEFGSQLYAVFAYREIGLLLDDLAVRQALAKVEVRCKKAGLTSFAIFNECSNIIAAAAELTKAKKNAGKFRVSKTNGDAIVELKEIARATRRLAVKMSSFEKSGLISGGAGLSRLLDQGTKEFALLKQIVGPNSLSDLLSAIAAGFEAKFKSKTIEQKNKRLIKGAQTEAMFTARPLLEASMNLQYFYRDAHMPDFALVASILGAIFDNPPDVTTLRKEWKAMS